MGRNLLFPTLLAALLMGCSQAPQSTADATATAGIERSVKEVTISSGTPVTMADLSIEGMSCEMMCGGSIRKALAKLPGVSVTEIAFNEGEARDHAIVTYDDTKVSDAQMIETIQALHDGQYKVLAVEITKQVPGSSNGSGSSEKNEDKKQVNVYAPVVSIIPGVLALLTQIMRP